MLAKECQTKTQTNPWSLIEIQVFLATKISLLVAKLIELACEKNSVKKIFQMNPSTTRTPSFDFLIC